MKVTVVGLGLVTSDPGIVTPIGRLDFFPDIIGYVLISVGAFGTWRGLRPLRGHSAILATAITAGLLGLLDIPMIVGWWIGIQTHLEWGLIYILF